MTIALCILGGFAGGVAFTALFAKKLLNGMSSELNAIAAKLHRN